MRRMLRALLGLVLIGLLVAGAGVACRRKRAPGTVGRVDLQAVTRPGDILYTTTWDAREGWSLHVLERPGTAQEKDRLVLKLEGPPDLLVPVPGLPWVALRYDVRSWRTPQQWYNYYIINYETGAQVHCFEWAHPLAFSPDGRYAAYVCLGEGRHRYRWPTLKLYDFQENREVRFGEGETEDERLAFGDRLLAQVAAEEARQEILFRDVSWTDDGRLRAYLGGKKFAVWPALKLRWEENVAWLETGPDCDGFVVGQPPVHPPALAAITPLPTASREAARRALRVSLGLSPTPRSLPSAVASASPGAGVSPSPSAPVSPTAPAVVTEAPPTEPAGSYLPPPPESALPEPTLPPFEPPPFEETGWPDVAPDSGEPSPPAASEEPWTELEPDFGARAPRAPPGLPLAGGGLLGALLTQFRIDWLATHCAASAPRRGGRRAERPIATGPDSPTASPTLLSPDFFLLPTDFALPPTLSPTAPSTTGAVPTLQATLLAPPTFGPTTVPPTEPLGWATLEPSPPPSVEPTFIILPTPTGPVAPPTGQAGTALRPTAPPPSVPPSRPPPTLIAGAPKPSVTPMPPPTPTSAPPPTYRRVRYFEGGHWYETTALWDDAVRAYVFRTETNLYLEDVSGRRRCVTRFKPEDGPGQQ